jgi:hypothetical protein
MTINEPYYCTALYDMVRRPMQENSYGFTIILVILYGQMFMMCYDGSWIKWLFETSTPCLNEVTIMALLVAWATQCQTQSDCYYMMVCIHIRGTGIVIQVHWDSLNPVGNGLIS